MNEDIQKLEKALSGLIEYPRVEKTDHIKRLNEHLKNEKGLTGFHSTPIKVERIKGRLTLLIDLDYIDVDLEKWAEGNLGLLEGKQVPIIDIL